MKLNWEKNTKDQFEKMIEKTPIFIRDLAREKVKQRAEKFASEEGLTEVTEKNMIDAFFKETPGGFHGPLTVDMEDLGLNYQQYGHQRP